MLKLILADNQAIFRAGAAKVLAVEDEIRVVAQTQNYEQTLMALEKFRASILIFASALHPALRDVIAAVDRHDTKLVVVAENGENLARYVTRGVHGVVFRNVTGSSLVECIRKVAKGQSWVQSEAPIAVSSDNGMDDKVGARVRDRLTPKELKIVSLIVQVIKNYLRNVYDKIGVSDRLELALFTIHHRMLAEAAAASTASTNTPN